jgi:hypothetical protein
MEPPNQASVVQHLQLALLGRISLALYGIAAGLAAVFGLTRFVLTMLYSLQFTIPPRSFQPPCCCSSSPLLPTMVRSVTFHHIFRGVTTL